EQVAAQMAEWERQGVPITRPTVPDPMQLPGQARGTKTTAVAIGSGGATETVRSGYGDLAGEVWRSRMEAGRPQLPHYHDWYIYETEQTLPGTYYASHAEAGASQLMPNATDISVSKEPCF